jgi:hypothetical protein
MRWLWIAVAVGAVAVMCCGGLGLYRFISSAPWRMTVLKVEAPRFPSTIELHEDRPGVSMTTLSYDDGMIASVTIMSSPRDDWIVSGGHSTGGGIVGRIVESEGGNARTAPEPSEPEELPETAVQTPGPGADNADDSDRFMWRAMRDLTAYQMKRKAEGKHDTCTLAVKGAVGSSEDAFIVTPEEMRKSRELLKKHDDIIQAARECWKDNPAVLRRLEEFESE